MQLGRWISINSPAILALITGVVVWGRFAPRAWYVNRSVTSTAGIIAFGVLLLFLAIFPFQFFFGRILSNFQYFKRFFSIHIYKSWLSNR
jgi:hypothetical protein